MIKLIMVAVAAALVSQAVQASTFHTNDLYLGFTLTSAQDDYIIDLGQPNTIGVGGSAVVDLSSQFSLSTFNSVFTGGANGVTMAVVGGDNIFGHGDVFGTQLRVGGAGTPAVPGSSLTYVSLPTSGTLTGAANTLTSIPLPTSGNSTIDPTKTYSQQVTLVGQQGNFQGKSGINPDGTVDGSGILYEDLYEVTPTAVSYLGYFTMDLSTATPKLTFTPLGAPSVNTPPPAPSNVTIVASTNGVSGSNNAFNVQFGTTNGATYTLYFTNSTGLTTSVTNWPVWPTTIVGNGGTTNFSINATNLDMFFRIGAH